MTTTFYEQLAVLEHFADVTEPRNFVPLPSDWHIVISDVKGSTQAIAAGRYKEVNMLGAASIVALLNAAGAAELPFVFGGDGATLAIPPDLLPQANAVLAALQELARREFALELRAGIVPMGDITAEGYQVQIARLRVSEHYAQAVFSGGGLACAERLIKDPATGPCYAVPPAADAVKADLTGLECRWQDIPSRHGETVSLLVMVTPRHSPGEASAIYREVIATLEAIYGSERDYHPLALEMLKTSYNPRKLLVETRLHAPVGLLARMHYLARIWWLNLLVAFYRGYQALTGKPPWWDQYRELVFRNADYKKYDDTLRMIIAGTPEQRARLMQYLEQRYQQGDLVYGLHVTNRALMTCLVFERVGRQVHFVDGADGGYALAAQALKARLKAWMHDMTLDHTALQRLSPGTT